MAGPLEDIVVLDLTRALAGPHATMLLGDLGARVIKIEQPGTGDESRHWGPPFAAAPDGEAAEPESTYFLSCNRNKESVTCDLRSEPSRELLTRLIRRSDVLAENFRPGVLDRLGFSVSRLQELNPRLVICSITGFGHDGPEGSRPGYDQIVQGEAGLMSVTGPDADHPVKVGLPIADVLAGVNAALGVVAALHERSRTGLGRVVRTSLLASVVGAHAFQGTRWTVAREVPGPAGLHHPSIMPYGVFRCRDGMIQVAVPNESLWQRFAPVVGIDPDDERFRVNHLRVTQADQLIAEIESALSGGDRAHWLGLLAQAGVPAGSIRTMDEVYDWEQARSQGLVISVDHASLGAIELPGPVLRFDGEAPRAHVAPPLLGQHDEAIREWLDAADADAALSADGAAHADAAADADAAFSANAAAGADGEAGVQQQNAGQGASLRSRRSPAPPAP
jgi:crotonobetainyl-CoA:carnitine CoA-transferase CaiB-like acyl-CoA transferase